ncbi:medium-chain acyl-CoA ligase ACSF2, mitochondrial-like [Ylistrum balloti]|uniref:medium-chain acyl-CoA ligase ACSF2, mitochondrial-like n=1 Tax=Ylistrum balloti TaxID=509963 RepID=UPI002905B213|nr:medium-chain acyl-CoA ligase ACSF2, mitochondrial-like [Ylistrum balloti]
MEDLSYLSRPNPSQIRYKSIIDVLREKTDVDPEKEIFVERSAGGGRRSLTYAELMNRSTNIAKYLIAKGIRPEDSIAIIGPNSIEWIIGEFAIFMTGAIAVHFYETSESFSETLKILTSTKSKAVLLDPESDQNYLLDIEAYLINDISSQDKPIVLLLRKSTPSYLPSLADVMLTADEEAVLLPRIKPDSIALIFTTSGSTGVPKMVEMDHVSFVNASYMACLGSMSDRPIDNCYNDRPFAWMGGSPIFSILNGNKRVFVDNTISIKKENILMIWNIIMVEHCSSAFFLPYAVLDILANIEAITSCGYKMYAICTGGQHISRNLTQLCDKCTEKMFMIYGSTEVGAICSTQITPEMEEGNVGSLFPGYEVKIVNDKGETNNREMLGEILVRSSTMMQSYRDAPELNAASFADGRWFRTGDIGTITKNGKLLVKGKSKDIIKRGGLKVFTSVVEAAMSKLSDVREVIVIPVPDSRLYEEVCACYILEENNHTTEIELDKKCRDFLGDNVLGSTPSYYLRFNSFPRLNNGKADKVLVKTQALNRLNLM